MPHPTHFAPILNQARCSARFWLAILLLGLGCSIARAQAASEEVWRLDKLENLGGHAVRIIGAPKITAVAGRTAAVFDGVHDGLFVDRNPVANASSLTIEALIFAAGDGGKEQRFFHVEDDHGRRALLETRNDGHGSWWLDGFMRAPQDLTEKSGLTLINPKLVHPVERWHWVALRCDGHHLTTFVNGRKECEGERTFVPLGTGRISIGVRQNLVYWFKGAIAEIRFHREAVTDEQLQRIEP